MTWKKYFQYIIRGIISQPVVPGMVNSCFKITSNLGHYLFHKYLLSAYNAPGTILSTKDLLINQPDKKFRPHRANILVGGGGKGKTRVVWVI